MIPIRLGSEFSPRRRQHGRHIDDAFLTVLAAVYDHCRAQVDDLRLRLRQLGLKADQFVAQLLLCYAHWEGARRAVDEYFAVSDTKVLLNRIDHTGRIRVWC
jgi:hypothetical protein